MAGRVALAVVAFLVLLPGGWRRLEARRRAPEACRREGRGQPPRHWIGCRADPGSARALGGRELLALGRPMDLNAVPAEDLAAIPGISVKLASAIVEDRERRGPFPSVEALLRVRGIGPVRYDRARRALEVADPGSRHPLPMR